MFPDPYVKLCAFLDRFYLCVTIRPMSGGYVAEGRLCCADGGAMLLIVLGGLCRSNCASQLEIRTIRNEDN